MKKLLLTLLAVILTLTVNAERVSKQEALQKARQFMPGKKFKDSGKASARLDGQVDRDAFYIFNAENNGGFVIVSGDDRTTEILGYSDRGELNFDKAPCNVKWLLECYQHVIDSLAQEPNVKAKARTRGSAPKRTAIEPLITTHWGQGAPYNNMCPEIEGEKCMTGCVATAMAQIMNFHKWPKGNTSVIEAYTSGRNNIDMPQLEPTSFDWAHMRDEYTNVQTTDAENQAVAKLMKYCGQAVNMDYGTESSGAGTYIYNNLINLFGYSRGAYSFPGAAITKGYLEEVVYKELEANRPVFYTGSNSQSSHAFVVDGYHEDGTFHINWGWDGDADGYFVLTGLTEDVMPYPYDGFGTTLTTGIEPPGEDYDHSKVRVTYLTCNNRSVYREDPNGNYLQKVGISGELYSDIDGDYYVGFGLFDDRGLVKVLSSDKITFPLNSYYSLNDYIGKDIPVGDYYIYQIYRHNESEDWMKCEGSNLNYYIVHVKEKSFVLDYIDNCEEYLDYGVYEKDGVTYKLCSEAGNDRAYVLPFHLSGKYSGDVVVPNTITTEAGQSFMVFSGEFDPFVDCPELTSLTSGIESGYVISNCKMLSNLVFTHGEVVQISCCPMLESVEFPITMSDPIIQNCENLKTITAKCLALNWDFMPVYWDDKSLPSLQDVYFYTQSPPPVCDYHDENWNPIECDVPANSHAKLHVPKGSLAVYQNSRWKLWNIVDDVEANPFVTWGYCHGNAVIDTGMASGMGDNDCEYAMCIPSAELEVYKGNQITHIEVYSPGRSINDYGFENYEYVFITKPGTDYLVKQPFEVIRGAWNTIELDEPYTITGDSLFVGVGRHGQIGIRFSDDTYVWDASWQRAMGNDYGDTEGMFIPGKWVLPCPISEAHPLPIRFAIGGESVPEGVVIRDMKLVELDDPTASARARGVDSGVKIQGTIRNRSLERITSYTVEWTIDGSEKGSQTFETEILPNACEFITIDLPEKVGEGHHEMTFDVTSINNGENNLSGTYLPVFEIGEKTAELLPGDANGDGELNETDRNYIVRHIMGDTPEDFDEEAADLNGDKTVNTVDLVKLINLLKATNTQSFNEYIWETGVNNNWGQIEQPLYCTNQDGIYVGFFYAQDADWSYGMGAFKFTGAFNSWDEGNYGTGTINDDGLSGTLIDDDGSGNITATPGFYKATVNLANMTYSLTPIASIGIIGPAAGGWGEDTDLTYNPQTRAWEGTIELTADEFKFRANDSWEINWGGETGNLTQDGNSLTISEAGTYFIQFFPLCETKSYCTLTKK